MISEQQALFESNYLMRTEEVQLELARGLMSVKAKNLTEKGKATLARVFNIKFLHQHGILLEPGSIVCNRNGLFLSFRLGAPDDYDELPTMRYQDITPNPLTTSKMWFSTDLVNAGLIKESEELDPIINIFMLKFVSVLIMLVASRLLPTLDGDGGAIEFCIWFQEVGFNNLDRAKRTFADEILLRACRCFAQSYHDYSKSIPTQAGVYEKMIHVVRGLIQKTSSK